MRRLWVLSLTMCIVSSVTTDTPQTSRLPGTTTPPAPAIGSEALSSAAVTLSASTPPTPGSAAAPSPPASAPPPAPPPAPTAAALAAPAPAPGPGPAAGGVSYAPRLPGPDGQVVLLTTPRTAPAPPPGKSHTDSPMLNYIYDARSSAHKHMHHSQRFGPTFETNTTSITVQIGSTASIDCKISLLQDNAVSWVLRPSEDSLRLLTVGQMTWSGDARHSVEFHYPNNWRLIVKNVTKADEGTYECQISTHPPKLIRTHLLVNVPEVLIVDEKGLPIQDKHYETSSTIRLSCIVRHVYMTGSVVSWIHQGVLLNQDSTRGGISVKSELREDGAESVLSVARVDKADSGNYTCSISPSQRTTVLVHVLDGESMAELHLGSSCCAPRPPLVWMLVLLLLSGARRHAGR